MPRGFDQYQGPLSKTLFRLTETFIRIMLHEAIFRATCLATPLRNKLHEPLLRVTLCAACLEIALRDKLNETLPRVKSKYLTLWFSCLKSKHLQYQHLNILSQYYLNCSIYYKYPNGEGELGGGG